MQRSFIFRYIYKYIDKLQLNFYFFTFIYYLLLLCIGINTFDTSPYYGRSEYILGDALSELKEEFPRNTYYLETKIGRYGYYQKDFDYSKQRTIESVKESLHRLKTDYIDIVLCHDVEFVDINDVVGENGALEALYQLKQEGVIKYVGCSGKKKEIIRKKKARMMIKKKIKSSV